MIIQDVTIAGAKIWPLCVAVTAAATAAGVTVWAAYASRDLSMVSAHNEPGDGQEEAEAGAAPPAPYDMAGAGAAFAVNPGAPGGNGGVHGGDSAAGTSRRCTAVRYALALQEGRTDDVIALTHWMQERLKRVRLGSDDSADMTAAREELRGDIVRRTLEGNRLRPEGVEDKYIFAPGARIEVVGADKRRDSADALSCPVKERTWLRVEYPAPAEALRDEAGRPIRSIVVGVDVSWEGLVVKAGVLGNVELDREAIRLNWGE